MPRPACATTFSEPVRPGEIHKRAGDTDSHALDAAAVIRGRPRRSSAKPARVTFITAVALPAFTTRTVAVPFPTRSTRAGETVMAIAAKVAAITGRSP